MKKLTGGLLAAVLSLGIWMAPDAADARDTAFFDGLPDEVPSRDELEYGQADATRFYILGDYLLSLGPEDEEELLRYLLRYNGEYAALQAAESLAMMDYYAHPQENEDCWQEWQQLLIEVGESYRTTWRKLLTSDKTDFFRRVLSPDAAESLLAGETASAAEMAELAQIMGMADKYWAASERQYTVSRQGRQYGFDDLADISDADTYNQVYLLLAKERNAALAGILADTIPAANAYAVRQGYPGYAEYAYAARFGREYSPEDSARLYAAVKQYIVPLYHKITKMQAANDRFSSAGLSAARTFADSDALLDAAAQYIGEISDEYAAALTLLREKNLADIKYDPGRIGVSFTTYVPYYSLAMIFSGTQNGEPRDIGTFIHEFGHFAYYMYRQQETPLDISEFYSQGLESLFCSFADELFGAAGDTYRLENLEGLLRAVINGCLYDEFQVQAYRLKQPTVRDINRLYYRLSLDYGFEYAHDEDEAYNWVTTPHTFIQPFYYLSYAASALPSAELLVRADRDFEDAADLYLKMAADYKGQSYSEFFAEYGFADMFDAADVAALADGLQDYLYGEICRTPGYDDLSGHWGYDELCYAYGLSLLQGDEQGLRPDDTALRCEVFTVLQRLLGGAAAESAGFTDVAEDDWFAPAVDWAAAEGLARGNDDNTLQPLRPMTRQELVTVLYRAIDAMSDRAAADASDRPDAAAVLADFADGAAVADWAADACARAVSEGFLLGDNGLLRPDRPITRAELAALLIRCFGL